MLKVKKVNEKLRKPPFKLSIFLHPSKDKCHILKEQYSFYFKIKMRFKSLRQNRVFDYCASNSLGKLLPELFGSLVIYYIYNHPFQRAEHFEVGRSESNIVGSSTSLFNLHKSSTKQNIWSNFLITVILTSRQVAAWMHFIKVLLSVQIHNMAYFPFQTSQLLFIFCQDNDYWYYWIISHKKKERRKNRGKKKPK